MRRLGLIIVIVAAVLAAAVGGFLLFNNWMAAQQDSAPPPPPPASPAAVPVGAGAADPATVFDGLLARSGVGAINSEFVSFEGADIALDSGIRYATQPEATLRTGADPIAMNGPNFADSFGLTELTIVQIRRVTRDEATYAQVPEASRANDLCAPPAPATFIALGYGNGPEGKPEMSLLAFRGPTAPGPEAATVELCGPGTRFARPEGLLDAQ